MPRKTTRQPPPSRQYLPPSRLSTPHPHTSPLRPTTTKSSASSIVISNILGIDTQKIYSTYHCFIGFKWRTAQPPVGIGRAQHHLHNQDTIPEYAATRRFQGRRRANCRRCARTSCRHARCSCVKHPPPLHPSTKKSAASSTSSTTTLESRRKRLSLCSITSSASSGAYSSLPRGKQTRSDLTVYFQCGGPSFPTLPTSTSVTPTPMPLSRHSPTSSWIRHAHFYLQLVHLSRWEAVGVDLDEIFRKPSYLPACSCTCCLPRPRRPSPPPWAPTDDAPTVDAVEPNHTNTLTTYPLSPRTTQHT